MSSLDKDWMSPQLKQMHRSMQREFFKNRKSQKYLKLKSKFKKLKRNTVKTLYSGFVTDLKSINPGKWYSMARKIGAVDKSADGDIKIEALSKFTNSESAQIIAEHFSAVSNSMRRSAPNSCRATCRRKCRHKFLNMKCTRG